MSRPHINLSATVVALALVLVLSTPAAAQPDDKWILRLDIAGLNQTGGSAVAGPGESSFNLGTGGGAGFSAALEYRFGPRLGLEIGAMLTGLGSDLAFSSRPPAASMNLGSFVPLSGALNVHLTPQSAVDVYAGPMVVYSIMSGISMQSSSARCEGLFRTACRSLRVGSSTDLGLGLQAGIDIPFGQRRWGFHSSIRYMHVSQELSLAGLDGQHSLELNPVVVSAGLSVKF